MTFDYFVIFQYIKNSLEESDMKKKVKKNRNYFYLVIFLFVFIFGCSEVAPEHPVITSFTADSTTITEGESVGLSWVVSDASTVMINQGIGNVGLTGSTSVSPITTTTYTLTATNSAGPITAMVTITVNPVPIIEQNITIQPGPTEGMDSYVSSFYPDSSAENSVVLIIGNWSDKTYLKFDLGILPAGAVITNANLKLYQWFTYGSSDFVVGAHRVTQGWAESVITWDNQPTYSDIPESTIFVTAGAIAWRSWNITSLVQDWTGGSIANYGVVLTGDGGTSLPSSRISCYSSDNTDNSTLRPKLEIAYYVP